ncbi:MAG: ankyrin repeat domain-containing protein [Planctomycetota bacterium]
MANPTKDLARLNRVLARKTAEDIDVPMMRSLFYRCFLFRKRLLALEKFIGPEFRRAQFRDRGPVATGIAMGDGLAALDAAADFPLEPALRIAVALDELEVAKELVRRGAEVLDLQNPNHETDLPGRARRVTSTDEPPQWLMTHVAARTDAATVLEWLLSLGVHPDCIDEYGNSPLHEAASTGSLLAVRVLLRAGASLYSKGRPIIVDAEWEAVPLLLDAGADIDSFSMGFCPLINAVEENDPEAVLYLLNRGATVDNRDATNQTALHFAVRDAHPDIVDILLAHGADPNIQDLDCEAALDFARSDLMYQKLVAAGARHGFRREWERENAEKQGSEPSQDGAGQ